MKREETLIFALDIEQIVKDKKVSYMDAILLYCEKNNIEIEIIPKLITGTLKTKIKQEAENLNFLPKPTNMKLPFT